MLVRRLHETEQRLRELIKHRRDGSVYPPVQPDMLLEAQETLRLTDHWARGMFASSATGMAVSTPSGRFLRVNTAYCRMLGYTEDELMTLDFASLTHPDDLPLNLKMRDELLAGQRDGFVMEKRYLRKNGDTLWTRHSVSAERAVTGEIATLTVVAEDITERKLAELRLLRLNRLHTVLSKIAEAIVRTRDRKQLYDLVCRIIVEYGALRMVIIAELDAEAGLARPVAFHGAGLEYLLEPMATIPIDGSPLSQGPIGTSLRTGVYDVCNDIFAAPRMKPWQDAARRSGFVANASFPLKLHGVTIGVLVLYAGETGYFLGDEIDLMLTIVENLSFALEALAEEQQRKRAEAEVVRQQTELQVLFDLMPAFILFVDTQNRILRINRHAALAVGQSAAMIEGKQLSEVYPAETAKLFSADAEVIHFAASKLGLVDRIQDKDGKALWLQTDKVPYRDADGNIMGAIVMCHDITERNRLERRFRRLVDSDVQCVIFWNKDGQITSGNDSFLRLVGYSRADLEAGRINWVAMTPAEHVAADQRALASIAATGICPAYEKELFRKDGSRAAVLIGSAVFEDTPEEGVSFILDLTARRELEQQLRQAQKMQAIGQLTGGIAHDFNNLLGIIRLNLELIIEHPGRDPHADEMAAAALQATDRGASLTHRLLAYARQQPLEPSTVNVGTLLSEMTALLNRTLGESIEIKTIMPGELWATIVDPHQLENALLNLAVNASHAMPDGGKLIIEASNKVFDDLYLASNPDVLPGAYVQIAVTDTGTGMPADILERVLEPFFTTKPVGKGSGLGLSMVHGFAKQSGGHLKIYSEPGHGTTVNLYLPKSMSEPEANTPIPRRQAPAAARSECVLVVEDDAFLRAPTVKVLTSLGYRTIEAEDGPSALLLLDQIEQVDLLLTDVVLPKGMFGPELAHRVCARWPGVKVLYMSGYPRDAVLHNGVLDNRAHLIAKPFAKAELAVMVRRVLDEGNMM